MKKFLALAMAVLTFSTLTFGVACDGENNNNNNNNPPAHTHTLTEVAEKAANCKEGGNEAYWVCSDAECGKMFADAAATQELDAIPTTNKTYTHTWDEGEGPDAVCGTEREVVYTCEVCERKRTELEFTEHQFDTNGKCSVCEYKTEGLTFAEAGEGYEVTGYTGSQALVAIPATYSGKPVTAIVASAFTGNTVMEEVVIVGENMTTINTKAFKGATALKKITLPQSLTSIGWSETFQGCSALEEIDIPFGVRTVPQYCFSGCTSLKKVVLNGVTTVEIQGFNGCTALYELTLNEGLESVGESAFIHNGISELTIPSTLTSIGQSAFVSSKAMQTIKVAEGNTAYKMVEGCLIEIATMKVIEAEAGVTAIPAEAKVLGRASFFKATLEQIFIPKTLEQIETKVFDRLNEGSSKSLTINFEGTEEEWNALTKAEGWDNGTTITVNFNQSK